MSINYNILKRHYGTECQWYSTVDGVDYAESFIVNNTQDVEKIIQSRIDTLKNNTSNNIQVDQTNTTILSQGEPIKEEIKFNAISFIRNNPDVSSTDWLSILDWHQKGLAEYCIYQYAVNARDKFNIQLQDEQIETCWSLLKNIVLSMTDEQLLEALK